VIVSLPILGMALAAQPQRTLLVSGHSGELAVMEMGGRSYVEIEALARLANGSVSFNGNQIVLTLPAPAGNTPATTSVPSQSVPVGFTKEFIRAGIEEMSVIREWRSTLTNAVQRGYPVTEDWIAGFRERARKSLGLVAVAASTESDRSGLQLLTNVFNNMNKLSDRFLEGRTDSRNPVKLNKREQSTHFRRGVRDRQIAFSFQSLRDGGENLCEASRIDADQTGSIKDEKSFRLEGHLDFLAKQFLLGRSKHPVEAHYCKLRLDHHNSPRWFADSVLAYPSVIEPLRTRNHHCGDCAYHFWVTDNCGCDV